MAINGSLLMIRNAVGNCRSLLINRYLPVSYQQNASLKQTVEERVGLPKKPKRPLLPYFRFMAKMRPSVVASHPDAKITEIVQMIAQQWAKVDPIERKKLETEYRSEVEAYSSIRNKYEETITAAQRDEIKQLKLQDRESKEKTNIRKKKRELGKPKRPITAFLQFMQSKAGARGSEPFKDWQSRLAQEWAALPQSEKDCRNASCTAAKEAYKRELHAWEEKMIRLGHIDVVRNEALIQPQSAPRPARSRAAKE